MHMPSLSKTIEIAIDYLLGDRNKYNNESEAYKEIFVAYLSDKNSSTLREALTLKMLGYDKIELKHGADGKHPKTGKFVEVKPQYAHIDKNGKQKKLGGGGTFNDIHYDKVKGCKGWDIVCSGFAEDKLVYIIRFPFNHLAPVLKKFIDKKIEKNNNKKKGKTQGRFSTMFGYNKYIDCPDLEIIYFNETHAGKYMSKIMYNSFAKKYNA